MNDNREYGKSSRDGSDRIKSRSNRTMNLETLTEFYLERERWTDDEWYPYRCVRYGGWACIFILYLGEYSILDDS